MTGSLDEGYFEWLYKQIGTRNRNPARSYWLLAEQLHKTEFVWSVPNDDNRVMDGIELRSEFIETHRIEGVSQDWLDLGCSVLEMLVALARLASFEASGTPSEWFASFVQNLGLRPCSDERYSDSPDTWAETNEAIERLVYRTYEPSGLGGLFPLEDPQLDQRRVEIWYQLSAYLLEKDRVELGPSA